MYPFELIKNYIFYVMIFFLHEFGVLFKFYTKSIYSKSIDPYFGANNKHLAFEDRMRLLHGPWYVLWGTDQLSEDCCHCCCSIL